MDFTVADIIIGALLAVVVGVMPIVVRFTDRPLPPELVAMFRWRFPGGLYPDFFTYWKGWFIGAPAVFIGFYFISDTITRGNTPDFKGFFTKMPVIFSLSYIVFMIISTLASQYSYTSLWGTFERSEGMLIWLAYFTVFFAAALFVRGKQHALFLMYALAFSSIIMGAVGVSQLIGRDLLYTSFVTMLMTHGTRLEGVGIEIGFDISFGTLYNPNTFGKYTAMISPVLLLGALTYDGKKHINIIFLIAGALMLVGVFASSSLGGLIGIITAVGVLVVTYLARLIYTKKQNSAQNNFKKPALISLGLVGVMVVSLIFIPPLNNRITNLLNRLGEAAQAETTALDYYFFSGDSMFAYRGDERLMSLTVHGMPTLGWLSVYDGSGGIVEPSSREEAPLAEGQNPEDFRPMRYIFDVPGYRVVVIERYPHEFLFHNPSPAPFFLAFQDGNIFGTSPGGELVDMSIETPAWGFSGRETWGSNRGYIWSRSFPLMPSRVLLGSGPDTFINVFPQNEFTAKQRYFHNPYIVIDKAHNLFIQTWITTGGISTIALFALFAHFLFTTFISLIKSKDEPVFLFGLRFGLLAGISAFVMSSMATDSTIGSTGVFFVLLGIGYGLNYLLPKKEQPATQ